jgi:hypothetical protein
MIPFRLATITTAYLTGSAVLTFVGLLLIYETKDDDLTVSPS